MLLTRSLSKEYLDIYVRYGTDFFNLRDISKVVGKEPNQLRKDMYILKNSLSLIPIERGKYRLVQPEKWMGMTSILWRFPELEPLFVKLLLYIKEIDGIFLYGSRARGDFRGDSDYDILIFIRDSRLKQKIKRIASGFEDITIEVFLTHRVEENMRLDPLFLQCALRESIPVFGTGLGQHFLKTRIDKVALITALQHGLKRLDKWEEFIDEKMDTLTILDIIYAIFLRIRQAYLTKMLLSNRGARIEEMLDEFPYQNKKTLKELYETYRAVRDDKPVPDTHLPSDKELRKLVKITKEYIQSIKSAI